MLDYMIKTNDLKQLFEKYKLDPKRDVDFIKEMIAGPKCESGSDSGIEVDCYSVIRQTYIGSVA